MEVEGGKEDMMRGGGAGKGGEVSGEGGSDEGKLSLLGLLGGWVIG